LLLRQPSVVFGRPKGLSFPLTLPFCRSHLFYR
jgi:hypothetical protein